MSSALESQNIASFRQWLIHNGAEIHPFVYFAPTPSGYAVHTQETLESDATIVSAPFSLAITAESSKRALQKVLGGITFGKLELDALSERQLICTYICLHWILGDSRAPNELKHFPYLNTLPPPSKLCTPLHFTSHELEAFKGSNLYGATLDRKRVWEAEWEQCQTAVASAERDASWSAEFTWERYLTAATYLSSRAFPSSLLSPKPTIESTPTSYPVLLPGIDALNHSRAHPVSWVVSYPTGHTTDISSLNTTGNSRSRPIVEPSISLVLHSSAEAGEELFNNYGLKPNSEFILGYGFSLPKNPDDTIVLQLGGSDRKWEVGRVTRGVEGLWEEILCTVGRQVRPGQEEEDGRNFEIEIEAADVLCEMTKALLGRLPKPEPLTTLDNDIGENGIRADVAVMLEHYVEGQMDILHSIIEFAQEKERLALEAAKEQGIEYILGEDDIDEVGEEDV